MVARVLKRGLLAGAAVLGAETLWAVLRPVPDLEEFDPSAEFGDPSHPTLRIAVLGDSSVTAPGVAGPSQIWVSHVARRLSAGRHVLVRSFAVGGSKASDLIESQLGPALEWGPDLVFVSVGANDAIRGVPIRRFEAHLDHLIGELAATGATVVQSGVGDLGTIPRLHPPLRHMISRRALRFDRAHRRVAGRHRTHVVDQRDGDSSVWYTDRSLWSEDLFHVSAAGHALWAESTWRTLEPLYEDRGDPA